TMCALRHTTSAVQAPRPVHEDAAGAEPAIWTTVTNNEEVRPHMETELAPRVKTRRSRHADTWVFYDGELMRYHEAYLPPMTHALHYGTGCFEGIRAYWNPGHNQLYLLHGPAHYERLRKSASILRLTVPHTTDELMQI